MLEPAKINEIVAEVATAYLKRPNVERVLSAPTVDSLGEDALRITIVVRPEAVELLKGNPLLDALVQIRKSLQRAGETRLPIVEYSTSDELEEDGTT